MGRARKQKARDKNKQTMPQTPEAQKTNRQDETAVGRNSAGE
ncbi:YfhD family protein [Alteribacter natronophilus]|nr:YfhD family protein [Alteribacter natronophilus]TMW73404.1 YfhD family protein [Alteribacter natronophilus]